MPVLTDSIASRLVAFFVAVATLGYPCALKAQQPERQKTPENRQKADTTAVPVKLDWWSLQVEGTVLADAPRWVSFDLETVLLDTLDNSPRIRSVSRSASIALERIIQQDAAFDANVLFESRAGRNNDPVGNSLVTGGPPRLIEESFSSKASIERVDRRGRLIELSQEVGLLDSNSSFFLPGDQGNSRLSLSLTQPLLDRGGRVYNERLLTQAQIDSRVSWQEMRSEVEQRIADVVGAYWRLYELRCHLVQQEALLKRGQRIEALLAARQNFDAGRIELAKARQRVARRSDRLIEVKAELQIHQARLANLVGSSQLESSGIGLEMIPLESPEFPDIEFDLRDAIVQGVENRPEIRAAVAELEAAALSVEVTRTELLPQLNAVVEAYAAGLRGDYQAFGSFGDQFNSGGPGLSGTIQYNMPYGRRAARSRHREAHHRYQQRVEQLREAIQVTKTEIESALISVNTAIAQRKTKHRLLETAIEEEQILSRRWEMMSTDNGNVGTVLETLLDAQQRRTDAEGEWISAKGRYVASLVRLQRAMGTLLIRKGITPVQQSSGTNIEFIQQVPSAADALDSPVMEPTRERRALSPTLQAPNSKPPASQPATSQESQLR